MPSTFTCVWLQQVGLCPIAIPPPSSRPCLDWRPFFGGLLTGLITYSIALLLQVYQTQQQIEKLEREHAMHAHAANSSAANSQEQQHQQAQAQEQQQTEPHEGRNGPADAFAATGMRQDGGAAPADSAATAADAQSQAWPVLLFKSHIYHRSLL